VSAYREEPMTEVEKWLKNSRTPCRQTVNAGKALYLVFGDASTVEVDSRVALTGQETLDAIRRGDIARGEALAQAVDDAMAGREVDTDVDVVETVRRCCVFVKGRQCEEMVVDKHPLHGMGDTAFCEYHLQVECALLDDGETWVEIDPDHPELEGLF
jgi:hypothetical protein